MNLTYRTGGSSRSTTIAQLFTAKSQKWLTVADSCRTSGRPSAAYRLTHRIFGHSRAVRAHLDAAGTASINLRSAVSRLPYNLPAQIVHWPRHELPHWSTSISRPAPERSPLGAARDHGGSHCRLPHAHTEVRIGLGAQSTLGACGVMDYAFLPPEINSARMYSGPGPNSMLVAAASWDALAAELASAAENYGSVIARLTGMHWWGPASTSMLAMSAPYVEWLERTAAQTKQTATQARAAAAAFEQAHAMTVPPALVTGIRGAIVVETASASNTAGTPP